MANESWLANLHNGEAVRLCTPQQVMQWVQDVAGRDGRQAMEALLECDEFGYVNSRFGYTLVKENE